MNLPEESSMKMSEQDVLHQPGHKILQPDGWLAPRGYSNGIEARGRVIAVGGQVGWDSQCRFHTGDFVGQARQALENIVAVLAEAGGRPEHIIRMTWYVVDKREYIAAYPELGRAYREVIGRNFPAMTAVQVAGLIEDAARVEIEATAVIPD
jgi:enamine deaminase RidA (YjgF/YER057c/UK114 family)